MLRQLLLFEAGRRLRQPAVLMIAAACFAYGLVISQDDIGQSMAALGMNASYRLGYFIALSSSLACLIAMLFCSQDALRDEEHRFDALIGLRAVQARWRSRAWVTQGTVLALASLISLGIWLGFTLLPAQAPAATAISPGRVVWPWLLFVLPNGLISFTLLSWVSVRWRRAGITFAAALLLLILSWMSLGWSGAPVFGPAVMARPEVIRFLSLIDPFALVWFFDQTQYWTPLQKNAQGLILDGPWLINRTLWLLLCMLVYWRLRRALGNESQWGLEVRRAKPEPRSRELPCPAADAVSVAHRWNADFQQIRQASPRQTVAAQTAALARRQLGVLYRGWSMPMFALIWMGLVVVGIVMSVGGFSGGEYSGHYPTTSVLITYCAEPLDIFATALLVLYSSELVWAEKRHRVDALIDASPAANGSLFVAKLVALASIPLLLISVMIVLAIGYQVAVGYGRLEPQHYLSLYYYYGLPLLLQAVALLTLQIFWLRTAWANRYTSLIVAAGFAMAASVLLPQPVADYPWLQINQFPRLLRAHSELSGYGALGERFHRLALHWSVVALALAAIGATLWVRGDRRDARIGSLTPGGSSRLRSATTCALATTVLASVLSAWWLQRQMPVHHDYLSTDVQLQSQADYERRFSAFRDQPVPQISDSEVRVDLYPEQQAVDFSADNAIHNRSAAPMQDLLVSSRLRLASVSIEGADLQQVTAGRGWHVYQFRFRTPLPANGSTRFRYRLLQRSEPFAIEGGLVENGSYFHHGRYEPLLGYVEAFEIGETAERARFGLPARPARVVDHSHGMGYGRLVSEKRRFDITLSTSADQLAVSSGERVREWVSEQRRYVRYRVRSPVYPLIGYFSAAYERRVFEHRGVPIEFYLHPDHHANVDAMLSAVRATLDYCSQWFGGYPFASLRIVEVPRNHGFGGRAAAGVIALNERLFEENVDSPALINNVLRNTIHEVAHQWWGEGLMPRVTPGDKVLTESLAKYVEAVVLGQMEGPGMLANLRDYNRRRYFAGRAHAERPEVALVEAESAYLSYGKGPLVFLALRELMGEPRLNAALGGFVQVHGEGMTATMPELVDTLRAAADAELRPLIDDWLGATIEYRLRLEAPAVERLADGRYAVQFDLIAERERQDADGRPRPVPIDEVITLAVMDRSTSEQAQAPPQRFARRVQQARTRIQLLSERRPMAVVVDPDATRIESDRSDNRLELDF